MCSSVSLLIEFAIPLLYCQTVETYVLVCHSAKYVYFVLMLNAVLECPDANSWIFTLNIELKLKIHEFSSGHSNSYCLGGRLPVFGDFRIVFPLSFLFLRLTHFFSFRVTFVLFHAWWRNLSIKNRIWWRHRKQYENKSEESWTLVMNTWLISQVQISFSDETPHVKRKEFYRYDSLLKERLGFVGRCWLCLWSLYFSFIYLLNGVAHFYRA